MEFRGKGQHGNNTIGRGPEIGTGTIVSSGGQLGKNTINGEDPDIGKGTGIIRVSIIANIIQHVMRFLTAIVSLLAGTTWKPNRSPPPIVVEPDYKVPTLSLLEAQELINPMSRPLVEIANTIASNLAKMNQCLEILEKANNDEERLKACLSRQIEVLRTTKLIRPQTVCTANSCITENKFGEVEFTAICHNECTLQGVPHDTIGHHKLKGCSCMSGTDHCTIGNCRCSYLKHQHITYSTHREVETVKDESVQKQIDENASVKAIVQKTLKQLAKEIEELEDEKNKIGTACAQFTVFLKEHATDESFTDMIDQFLESVIQHRRHTNQMDSCKELEKLRQEYLEEKQLLEKALLEEKAEKELLAKTYSLEKILQEQKELFEKYQRVSSSRSSWTGRHRIIWIPEPASKPLNGGFASLNPLSALRNRQPAPPKPFSRKPAPPPKSFFGGLAWLNPFSKYEPAPPLPKPLKLEDVPMLRAELEKLPLSGALLLEQLKAQG